MALLSSLSVWEKVQVHSGDGLGTQNQNKVATVDVGSFKSQEMHHLAQSVAVP